MTNLDALLSIITLQKAVVGVYMALFVPILLGFLALLCLVKDLDDRFKKDDSR